MLRLEVRNAAVPIEKKPSWIKTTARMGPEYRELQALVKSEGLHTVCQEAGCPNIFECWEDREATFLIGGDQCTRRCDFCQIDTGKPADLDTGEPRRVAESVQKMGLRYATITGVCPRRPPRRAAPGSTPRRSVKVHAFNPGTGVEILAPDFSSNADYLSWSAAVHRRGPCGVRAQRRDRAADLQAHPSRLPLRPVPRGASRYSRAAGMVTKSNLILGMGETHEEVSSRRCATCTRPAPRSSPSRSTCGPPRGTTRSTAGSSRRSSSSSRRRPRRSASPGS